MAKHRTSTRNQAFNEAVAGITDKMISPGTEFMGMIYSELIDYIRYKKSIDDNWKRVKVSISPSTAPGEGEIKIAHSLRSRDGIVDKDPLSCTIISNDSDMIMLALPMVGHDLEIINESSIISVSSLRQELTNSLVSDPPSLEHPSIVQDTMKDFVGLVIPLGSDYLPEFVKLTKESMALIIDIYKATQQNLDWRLVNPRDELEMKNFLILIEHICTLKESGRLNSVYSYSMDRLESRLKGRLTEYQEREIPDEDLRKLYYQSKFDLDPAFPTAFEKCIKRICVSYLRMACWIVCNNLGIEGCPSWEQQYPFQYCPCMADLLQVKISDILPPYDDALPSVDEERFQASGIKPSFNILSVKEKKKIIATVTNGSLTELG